LNTVETSTPNGTTASAPGEVPFKWIARPVGGSIATVARVVIQSNLIALERRKAVEDVLRYLSYNLNNAARFLLNGHSMSVGLIVPTIANPLFAPPSRVRDLSAKRIALTVCPLSNLRLCGVPSMDRHPLKELMASGLHVTINSDNPPYFDGYVKENLLAYQEALDLALEHIVQLARSGMEAQLGMNKERTVLLDCLDTYLAGHAPELRAPRLCNLTSWTDAGHDRLRLQRVGGSESPGTGPVANRASGQSCL